jgi:hypothetical protein
MKPVLPDAIMTKCDVFINNFRQKVVQNNFEYILYDKQWKESILELEKSAE